MGEWDQQWGREGRVTEQKRRRDEWEEEGGMGCFFVAIISGVTPFLFPIPGQLLVWGKG